jgi:glycerol-3-phosphate dehydrogenase (NAD(P)+)
MPISAAVAAILDARVNASEALELLMARDPKEEAV